MTYAAEQIHKLLATALNGGATSAEAQTAMYLARSIAIKNNVAMADIAAKRNDHFDWLKREEEATPPADILSHRDFEQLPGWWQVFIEELIEKQLPALDEFQMELLNKIDKRLKGYEAKRAKEEQEHKRQMEAAAPNRELRMRAHNSVNSLTHSKLSGVEKELLQAMKAFLGEYRKFGTAERRLLSRIEKIYLKFKRQRQEEFEAWKEKREAAAVARKERLKAWEMEEERLKQKAERTHPMSRKR